MKGQNVIRKSNVFYLEEQNVTRKNRNFFLVKRRQKKRNNSKKPRLFSSYCSPKFGEHIFFSKNIHLPVFHFFVALFFEYFINYSVEFNQLFFLPNILKKRMHLI